LRGLPPTASLVITDTTLVVRLKPPCTRYLAMLLRLQSPRTPMPKIC